MTYGIWSPTRQSSGTRAFMVTLRMFSQACDWVPTSGFARCWVVDSSCPSAVDDQMLGQCYDRMPSKPHVAFLSVQPDPLLPRADWTLFYLPLESGLVFNWIGKRGHAPQLPIDPPLTSASDMPWRQGLLRLKKWPNVARYGDSLPLTIVCSRLLAAAASYAEVLQWGAPVSSLDRMFKDALHEGLLNIDRGASPNPAPALAAPLAAAVPRSAAHVIPPTHIDASRWTLIKYLFGRRISPA